ncbi:MAG: methyltransferase [Dictyoglomus sp. NZ13-RE01]|nr:MAG: methyltransferase [Dictyoglomus sp. NZ13-RE01]
MRRRIRVNTSKILTNCKKSPPIYNFLYFITYILDENVFIGYHYKNVFIRGNFMNKWINRIYENYPKRFSFPILTYPILKILGYNVAQMLTDSEIHYLCLMKIMEKFDVYGVATAMDLSVEAEEFGCSIDFEEEEVPKVKKPLISSLEDIKYIKVSEVGRKRTKIVLETLERVLKENPRIPVFGSMIGPFSLSIRLYDINEIMVNLIEEPEKVHELLEKTFEFLLSYGKEMKRLGAKGVLIAEPAAGLLSPKFCDEFSSSYIKRITDNLQDEHFIVILHNCGNTQKLVDSMVSTGSKILHFGNAVDLKKDIIGKVPENIIVMGNLDPVNVFMKGEVKEIYNKTINLLEELKDYKNFVISSGCDIPYRTPLENIEAFFSAVKDYNEKL